MICDLPYNVLNRIVRFSDRNDRIKLAGLNRELNHIVCTWLYNTIIIVDNDHEIPHLDSAIYTLLRACDLPHFINCLNRRNFEFIDKLVVNTHSSEYSAAFSQLYHKLSEIWSSSDHVISFLNYDILSLRVTDSLNNYLELNSIQFAEYDDGDCILAKKSHKIQNLRNWFMFDILDFLVAPASEDLQRLGLYIESNHYQANADEGFTIEKPNFDNAKRNLANISELFLHSALAFVNFLALIRELKIPQLQLRRLSLTSTHRLRNDAILNFSQIINQFDLNNLEELELKISCARHHECRDLCMIRFFAEWKSYNQMRNIDTNIRKLSLVHHKSLTETAQFKEIVENFVFDSHFLNIREIYLNLSNTVRSPGTQLSIDLAKVVNKLHMLPELEVLHISSFMSEWMCGLPQLFPDVSGSYRDILVNRCPCKDCNVARSSFVELADLDKAKNYSHKVAWSDVQILSHSLGLLIDFSKPENVKFLQYITSLMKQLELIMERNLTSSGTMLDMKYMPISLNPDIEPFIKLMRHSCLKDIFQLISNQLSNLKQINFGGIVFAAGS
ncbi:hypothetical protein METSCH_B03500 [Metschnikowia aff. pulcherrima]|uniref:F-box domain-containing protein n=1 Tax=Metschnikowia aff. pulcherrima TaxID=2163413 RepID=A0A4P6XN05_9ASCO|nr:hypothetical protein METSCH_B03500 [Metschnikowia aff. pulcherrima]